MKAVISGGAGFIGCHLSRRLLKEGWSVTILDNFHPQIHGTNHELPADLMGKVELVVGDVRNAADWHRVLPGSQAVIHLAAETGTGQSMYEIARYEEVNIHGTALLLDELAGMEEKTVRKVVLASSRAIYGEGRYQCPEHGSFYPAMRSSADLKRGIFDPVCPVCKKACQPSATCEDSPAQPVSIYGFTKLAQEMMLQLAGQAPGFQAGVLRYQNVFGPGQSLKNPYTGILSIFSSLAKTGQEINIFEDGLETRDFVYIEDVVEATWQCLVRELDGYEVFNVGSGKGTTVLEVAGLINRFFGEKSTLRVSGDYRVGDIRHNFADLSRVNRRLGFSPTWSFNDGLELFLEWADHQVGQTGDYLQALGEMKARGLMGEKS
jgi:dTDP-L-rhamnose 4-epimerase